MGLRVDDYYELLALHKGLMEAKFNGDPDNFDVPGSPVLARLSKRVVNALVDAENTRGKPAKAQQWQQWRATAYSGRCWDVAVRLAKRESRWGTWSVDQQRDFARDLLAPFELTEAEVDRFVREVG